MNRRSFIHRSAVIGALGIAAPNWLLSAPDGNKTLTVIHTNDVHSRLSPFPANAGKYAGRGGVERRAKALTALKSQNKHNLILDAGDIFQGTPYFNFFGGEPELKIMTELGYHGATIGNHDFDAGIEGFEKQLKHARFPFVISNYNFSNTCLDGKTVSHQIYERGKMKIGVFGLGIELSGLVPANLYKETEYLDPIEIAKDKVKELREVEECDLVICLSHLGFDYRSSKVSDKILGSSVDGIDLIIGGHTHTFLPEPVSVNSPSGNEVLINQVGWAGLNLGVIQFEFNRLKTRDKKRGINMKL